MLPGRPQALLISLLTVHLDQLLRKVLWEELGHLWTGARTKHPIRGMLLASDWLLGLEVQSGTDVFRFSRGTETRGIYSETYNTLRLIIFTENKLF